MKDLDLLTPNPEQDLFISKKILKDHGNPLAIYSAFMMEQFIINCGKPFVLTHDDLLEKSGMALHKIRKCKKLLKKMGVLTTQMKGIPAKEYYILNRDQFISLLGFDCFTKVGI